MWRKMTSVGEIEKLDMRRLHKIRLRAKRMRYTIEFTRSLYEVDLDRADGMLRQLGKLQSALGKLTDIASVRNILKRVALEVKAAPRRLTRRFTIAGDQERQRSKQLEKAAKALKKLEKLDQFWS